MHTFNILTTIRVGREGGYYHNAYKIDLKDTQWEDLYASKEDYPYISEKDIELVYHPE